MALIIYILILALAIAIGIALAPFILPAVGILLLIIATPFVCIWLYNILKHIGSKINPRKILKTLILLAVYVFAFAIVVSLVGSGALPGGVLGFIALIYWGTRAFKRGKTTAVKA